MVQYHAAKQSDNFSYSVNDCESIRILRVMSSGLTGLDRLDARRRLKLGLTAWFAGSPNR